MIKEKVLDKYREFCELDGCEMGEAGIVLLDSLNYSTYLSDEFVEALEKEIIEQYNWFNTNMEIVDEEKTETVVTRKRKVLREKQ